MFYNKNEIQLQYFMSGYDYKIHLLFFVFIPGTYAFKLPKGDAAGVWVSFEDADTAGTKASYAKAKGLGGVAIMDITLDDFRGLCSGDKFPILRGAKYRL